MAATTKPTTGEIGGRILSLIIAILLAIVCYQIWLGIERREAAEPMPAGVLPQVGSSPAVTQCITARMADIEKMVSDGMLDGDAAAKARQDARSLCVQQN